MRHRTEMEQGKQVADAQPLYALDQLVAHRRGASGDQKPRLDDLSSSGRAFLAVVAERSRVFQRRRCKSPPRGHPVGACDMPQTLGTESSHDSPLEQSGFEL